MKPDTLSSIIESMEHAKVSRGPYGQLEEHSAPCPECDLCRLIALRDAAEKVDLVNLVGRVAQAAAGVALSRWSDFDGAPDKEIAEDAWNACQGIDTCDGARIPELDELTTWLAVNLERTRWKCKAQRTADPPQDCDWPFCGCDPNASKVIETLEENGHLKTHAERIKKREGGNMIPLFQKVVTEVRECQLDLSRPSSPDVDTAMIRLRKLDAAISALIEARLLSAEQENEILLNLSKT